jgi:hypothetical protein
VLYDALALHVALVIVVDHNRKDRRKPDFVGEVSPFFPLCIDEGSFCSMPNHECGTVALTRQAPGATNPQVLREQFKHPQGGGSAIIVGTRPLNGEATTAVMPCILLCRSSAGLPQQTTNPRDYMKKVEMTLCTFSFALSSPCGAAKSLSDRGTENTARRKDAVDKTPNRAGATPLFRLSAAQKVRGVVPARPRAARGSVLSTCSRVAKSLSDTESDNL